jgi:hypothetical protein
VLLGKSFSGPLAVRRAADSALTQLLQLVARQNRLLPFAEKMVSDYEPMLVFNDPHFFVANSNHTNRSASRAVRTALFIRQELSCGGLLLERQSCMCTSQ